MLQLLLQTKNICYKEKSDTKLNKEDFIFMLWKLSVFGHIMQSNHILAIQQVTWHELLSMPVKQKTMVIATN